MKRYLMDRMADELAQRIAQSVVDARKSIKKPLQNLVIWRDAYESFLPRELLLYWSKAGKPAGHDAAELILPAPVIDTTVPFSVFEVEDSGDKVLSEFAKRNKIKGLDWHGRITIPAIVLKVELERAYLTIPALLKDAGFPQKPTFKVWEGSPDGIYEYKDPARMEDIVADGVREKLKKAAVIQDFAEVCYESPARQKWLVGLAKAR